MVDAARKHLYLVDGTAQLFRAFFAIRGLTNADGVPTNALYGFTSMLRKMIVDEAPPYLAVAFDLEGPTFRHERFAEYKSHRPPIPEDLIAQMPRARDVCRALRIPVLEVPGYEADDLIATCTRLAREAGFRTTVVAGDKDLLQLVGPDVDVFNPSKNIHLDATGVAATFGVPPERVRDVLGLMGDAVDNIPGVPGVGEKTALAMIAAYGELERVLARAERFVAAFEARDRALAALADSGPSASPQRGLGEPHAGPAEPHAPPADLHAQLADLRACLAELREIEADAAFRTRLEEACALLLDFEGSAAAAAKDAAQRRRKLVAALKELDKGSARKVWTATHEHAADARMSRELATLDEQAPMTFEPEALRRTAPDTELARELFRSLGFRTFLAEVSDDAPAPGIADPALDAAVESIGTRAAFERFADAARASGGLALAVASEGVHPLRTRLVGLGLTAANGATARIAWSDSSDGGCDRETRSAVSAFLADEATPKAVHDWKGAIHALEGAGIRTQGVWLDTKVGAFLLDPGRGSYGLDEVARELLGEAPAGPAKAAPSQPGLFSPVAAGARVDLAAKAARTCGRIARELQQRMAAEGLTELYRTVDGPLLPILARMERTGIRVDRGVLEGMSGDMEVGLAHARERIIALAGEPLNPDSPKQLREVLFGKLGLKPLRKTAKSGVESTDAETLEDLAEDHEIARQILAYRELAKLKGTYVNALPMLIAAETGRVHTTYDPTGAATGRLSSYDPNLQNIPARTEAGRRIRAAFVPEPGFVFLAADYSQVELRILAHLCQDPELVAAFASGEDIHRRTASRIFGILPDLVSDEMRRRAKAVNFGILYGMSETRLARDQGISRAEAHGFIEAYFERFQRVRAYIDETRDRALREGQVRTLFGRLRKFPQLRSKPGRAAVEQALRAAVNTTIQGTAADLMKMAMIAVDTSLRAQGSSARMLLQVHDELLLEVPEADPESAARLVRSAMEEVWPLTVPLVVDQKLGKNWLDAT